METYITHGESAQIFIMRKTKLKVNSERFVNSLIKDFESKKHDKTYCSN